MSPTHRLPKHPAESYRPPKGSWKILCIDKPVVESYRPVLADPRMDSSKLEADLWKSELERRRMLAQAPGRFEGRLRSIAFERLMAGEGKEAFPNAKCPRDIAESLLRHGSRGMPGDLLKMAFNAATLGMGVSTYEHMLAGSTTNMMCDPFIPEMVSTGLLSVSEIAELREMVSPMGSTLLSFLEPVESLMPEESGEGILAIMGKYTVQFLENGRMADYPVITGLDVTLDSFEAVRVRSPEVLSKVATPRVKIDRYHNCVWVYDFDKGLRAVKLEE